MKGTTVLFLAGFSIGATVDTGLAVSEGPEVHIAYRYIGPGSRRNEITLEKKRLFMVSVEAFDAEPVCHSRQLTKADIRALLKRDGLFKLGPSQDDSDYECEGSRTLTMSVDARSIRLHEACKRKKDEADQAVDRAMDSLVNYLVGLVERDNEKCPEGV